MFHSRIALTPEYRRARLVVGLQAVVLIALAVGFYGFALYHARDVFLAIAGAR